MEKKTGKEKQNKQKRRTGKEKQKNREGKKSITEEGEEAEVKYCIILTRLFQLLTATRHPAQY